MAGPFYVEPAVGNDANAGTAWGAGNSWATIQKALDTAVAGEIVYCKGTETIAAQIDVDINSGTGAGGYIKFIGVNSSGVNDGTRYIIDANSNNVNCITNAGKNYIWQENIECKNSGNASGWAGSVTGYNWMFINCCANNNGLYGFDTLRYLAATLYVRCCAYGNTDDGFRNIKAGVFLLCSSHDNAGCGFNQQYGGLGQSMIACIAYDNGLDGYETAGHLLFNCITDNNSDDGITGNVESAIPLHIIGCRVTNHTSGGSPVGIAISKHTTIGWNYYENNTGDNIQDSAYANVITLNGAETNIEDQSNTNQGYTSLTEGSEDYNLRSDASQRRTAISIPTS